MKCIIQIPCFNEEVTLPMTIRDLPKSLPGVDTVEFLVINDGSTDRTVAVAKACGVHHIVGFRKNRGLACAFDLGLRACLARGADIIVNTDADNQYCGHDIEKLVAPLIRAEADMVIGDRQTQTIRHFSGFKKFLQKHGSLMVGGFAGLRVPDATSGFRAMTRETALELNVTSDFSYTLETLIQAGQKKLAVVSLPIRTNAVSRESRLFKSIHSFVHRSAITMLRVYTWLRPLKVFGSAAMVVFLMSGLIFLRFLYYFITEGAAGRIQSLLLGTILFIMGTFFLTIGILADMINTNRKLIERLLRDCRDTSSDHSADDKPSA